MRFKLSMFLACGLLLCSLTTARAASITYDATSTTITGVNRLYANNLYYDVAFQYFTFSAIVQANTALLKDRSGLSNANLALYNFLFPIINGSTATPVFNGTIIGFQGTPNIVTPTMINTTNNAPSPLNDVDMGHISYSKKYDAGQPGNPRSVEQHISTVGYLSTMVYDGMHFNLLTFAQWSLSNNNTPTTVPEPATILLLGLGLLGAAGIRRKL